MTIHQVVAVRDSALDAFDRPFFTPSIGVAVRSFGDEIKRPDSPMHKHPEDFELWHLGEYDDTTGRIAQAPDHRQIARGKDFAEAN